VFLASAGLSYALVSGGPVASEPRAEVPEPPPETVLVAATPVAAAEPLAASDAAEPRTLRVVTGRIPKGGSLFKALRLQGAETVLVHSIAEGLSSLFSFQNARAGDFFALIQDSTGALVSFEFQRGRREVYRLDRTGDGRFHASKEVVPLDRRVVQIAGIIERSLFETVLEQGERPELAGAFADIFVWDFDFSRQTRPGDEVRIVYEKFYDRSGFVRYGSILAAQYQNSQREFTAVYFENKQGEGDYFTPEGNSVRRTFLRAPLQYSRISARYSNSRLHPILKVRRPHHGIDYAAPSGTPIWAVADGEVIFKGWSGGFGRLVKIRHNNGYVTYYGHLSRYGSGIRTGQRVAQKQVIGHVGTSGLATGPHLDYRIKIGKRFVDPSRVRFPKGDSITSQARAQFDAVKEARLAELSSTSPPLVLEAAM
jgi:murein DD-endopeptidase MepM/ murein hydrolase activator NlpD